MKLRLCYRIEKEAGMGEDEQGNPAEVYACIKLNTKSYTINKKDYKNLVEIMKIEQADLLRIDKSLITPITLNEYLDNTEEEGDE